jgi:hypothetical protein
MKNPVDAGLLAQLLDELQNLSERSDDKVKTARRAVWKKLAEAFGKPPGDLASDLVRRLNVQPITVRRWISGEYGPRLLHLTEIRSHFGLIPPQERRVSTLEPMKDSPATFDGGFAALRTINHVFYCLDFACAMFIFKGMQAFRIGRSQQVRERVVKILGRHPELILYYVFPEESEAERSLAAFHARQYVKESGVTRQIRSVSVPKEKDLLGLGISPASPFVIRYGRDGIKEFNREIDIWFEIPIEELDAQNQAIDYGTAKSVFVQLPEEESMRVWNAWQPIVRGLLDKKVEFDERHLSG